MGWNWVISCSIIAVLNQDMNGKEWIIYDALRKAQYCNLLYYQYSVNYPVPDAQRTEFLPRVSYLQTRKYLSEKNWNRNWLASANRCVICVICMCLFQQLISWLSQRYYSVVMGNCYRVPRRGGSRKDVAAAYRPTSTYNKTDMTGFGSHGHGSHNAYIGSVSRRPVSSSTSLQHISEREPDGENDK